MAALARNILEKLIWLSFQNTDILLLSVGRLNSSLLRAEGKKEPWSCTSRSKRLSLVLNKPEEHRGIKSFLHL